MEESSPSLIMRQLLDESPLTKGETLFFISHFKDEAGDVASLLHALLVRELRLQNSDVFLDSDALHDVGDLIKRHVGNTRVLLLLQTRQVFWRPVVLLEIWAAMSRGIPIVTIHLSGKGYDYAEANNLLRSPVFLDELEEKSAGSRLLFERQGLVDFPAFQRALLELIPGTISVNFNAQEKTGVRDAMLAAIIGEACYRLEVEKEPGKKTTRGLCNYLVRAVEERHFGAELNKHLAALLERTGGDFFYPRGTTKMADGVALVGSRQCRESLVELVRLWGTSRELNELEGLSHALNILGNLAVVPSTVQDLVAAKIVEHCLIVMECQKTANIVTSAARLLAFLARESGKQERRTLWDRGAHKTLLELCPTFPTVVPYAIILSESLSVSSERQPNLVNLGASLVAIAGLGTTEDPIVATAACGLLENLSIPENGKVRLASEGSSSALVRGMKSFPQEVRLQAHACRAIANLTALSDRSTRPLVMSAQPILPILSALRAHRGDVGVCEAALLALNSLSSSSNTYYGDVIGPIYSHNGVENVLDAMRAHPSSRGVQDNGCRIVLSLTQDEEKRGHLIEAGAVEVVRASNAMGYQIVVANLERKNEVMVRGGASGGCCAIV